MVQDTEVQAQGSVAGFSDFGRMFEEVEATGKVTLGIPDLHAEEVEEDTALLNWLRSGFVEQ